MKSLEGLMMKAWKDVFKLNEAERAEEVMWGRWPAARAGNVFREMMETPEGRSAFCVWNGIWRLVTRSKSKGICKFNGQWITVDDVFRDTNIPKKTISAGFAYLKAKGWLVAVEKPEEAQTQPVLKTDTNRPPLACARTPASCSSSGSSSSGSSEEGGVGGTKPTAADFGNQTAPHGLSGHWNPFTLEQVIACYPKRTKPLKARIAVERALIKLSQRADIEDPLEWLEAKVREFADAMHGRETRFIPDPHNWLDNECFDEDPAMWRRDGAGASDGPTTAIGKGGF